MKMFILIKPLINCRYYIKSNSDSKEYRNSPKQAGSL